MRPRFSDLQPSLQKTFILVYFYLSSRNRTCFTYRGLRSWLHYNPDVRKKFWQEWHTTERNIRKLVEMDVLRRVRDGRKVVFCKGRYYAELVVEYNTRLRAHQAENLLELLARGDAG